jgi:hypothetical protein
MKQVYLDTIILKIIENSGNDPDLRPDFVRRVVLDRMREIIPKIFFPISMLYRTLENGNMFIEEPFIDVIAVTKRRDLPKFLCIFEEKVYDPKLNEISDYFTDDDLIRNSVSLVREYDFTVDLFNKKITVYTEEVNVSVFLYTMYKDKNSRVVVPEFVQNYLVSYGTLQALQVLLNKGLRGKVPGLVPQTRYTIKDLSMKVTREYISMQREINILAEKVIVKPVNSTIDAAY